MTRPRRRDRLPRRPTELRFAPIHIQTHILSGWVVGNLFRLSPRERALCMVAAAAPDVDGLGIVVSPELYWDLHHKLGHNVFFFAALAAGLAGLGPHRLKAWSIYFALGWVHFALDYLGSGPGWGLYPLWPVDGLEVMWPHAWPFFSPQNIGAAAALLAMTVGVALDAGRTPLEWFMPRLDARLVTLFRRAAGHVGARRADPRS